MGYPDWLEVYPGSAPLVVSLPHTGTTLPDWLPPRLHSEWRALKDADWFIDRLYDFAVTLDATVIRTRISRSVIDVNRDPSGNSLYPGQTTTGLCPLETFDGEPLYAGDAEPDSAEIASRRVAYFDPYHKALGSAIDRLRGSSERVVLYDCHSIRSRIPRLFEGLLPHVNIGTHSGASCDPDVAAIVQDGLAAENFSQVTNGRFKGGWITRHYGKPASGVHTIQVELACRGYLPEPTGPVSPENWPPAYDPAYARPLASRLEAVLAVLRDWAAH